ncbi:hypothetical protein BDP55DRAFT_730380 [Colletotrichum godetiae]|uniref:Uncharacterized protein n=1 Tax=Colletotrichum godetiae TaxID=1209918 RepID=A0AAJ0AGP6_9PEZI|nr:uncharacterized protein BDP55DRAFT_730380 [Colletotrichum godetiae]KAK1673572.1 hypothetical protein BDP55DRAFT_730380 [Colletotrichum godetiae]
MKYSIAALFLTLIASVTATPAPDVAHLIERQIYPACAPYNNGRESPFPTDSNWGGYALCCNYFGPNPPEYTGCCDRNGVNTGSGFPACVIIN